MLPEVKETGFFKQNSGFVGNLRAKTPVSSPGTSSELRKTGLDEVGGAFLVIIQVSLASALIQTPMDDASLCQLIREALHDPNKVKALALAIDQLPVIKAYLGKGWLPYYDEALLMTEKDVERNIKRFPQMYRLNLESVNCQNASEAANVRKRFISWVVMILKRDCQDVSKRANRQIIISINTPIGEDGSTLEETIDSSETLNPNDTPRLPDLDKIIAEEDSLKNQEQLALMVRLLDKNLSNCYPDGYSQANCYELVKRRLLKKPPQQWKEIAEELQISFGTVTSHWNRKCKPLLTQIEQNLES